MSKLVLTRKPGQGIRFELKPGLFLTATFETLSLNNGCRIRFKTTDFEVAQVVRVGSLVEISDRVALTVAAVEFGQAKILLDAPSQVRILRTELIGRTA